MSKEKRFVDQVIETHIYIYIYIYYVLSNICSVHLILLRALLLGCSAGDLATIIHCDESMILILQ